MTLDKTQRTSKYSFATFFYNQGIPILIDHKHAKAHNKILIFDNETVITGSYNFTEPAEDRNAENFFVILDKDLAIEYEKNWQQHADHSTPYKRQD